MVSDDFGATDEGTGRRHGPPRGRQQRARRAQRRRRHRRRQAGASRRPRTTTPIPTTTRCSSPSCPRWSVPRTSPPSSSTCRSPRTASSSSTRPRPGRSSSTTPRPTVQESDVAQIRVEVTDPPENRPPTAVRDDVVIPAGGSRLVYVLANDGDPDGDIVALVGHTKPRGSTVKEVDGVGYRRHGRARRPEPADVPLPDLRRPVRPGHRGRRRRRHRHRACIDQPPVARHRRRRDPCRRYGRRAGPAPTTTTPRAAPSRSPRSPRTRRP